MLKAVVSKASSDLESTISARASVIGVNAALSVAYKNLLDIVYKFHCLHQFERKNQWQLDPLVSPKPLWHPQGQFWYVQCASQVGTRVLQECALIPWCHPCPSESGAEEFGIVCLPLEVLHSEFHLCWLKKHQVAKKLYYVEMVLTKVNCSWWCLDLGWIYSCFHQENCTIFYSWNVRVI